MKYRIHFPMLLTAGHRLHHLAAWPGGGQGPGAEQRCLLVTCDMPKESIKESSDSAIPAAKQYRLRLLLLTEAKSPDDYFWLHLTRAKFFHFLIFKTTLLLCEIWEVLSPPFHLAFNFSIPLNNSFLLRQLALSIHLCKIYANALLCLVVCMHPL